MQITFDTNELSSTDAAVLRALVNSLDPEWPAENTPEKPTRSTRRTTRRAPAAKKPEPAPEPEPEQPAAEAPAPEAPAAEQPAPAAKKPEPAPAPAPEPEQPAEDTSDEDPMDTAVRLATALVQDGRGTEVRGVLKELDAKRVSDLKGAALDSFIKSAAEL